MSEQRNPPCTAAQRLFIGIYPAGLVYADTSRERHGDYARLAFLSFGTLDLRIENDCPETLRELIVHHAASIQARRGEAFQVSSSGQTVLLGHMKIEDPPRTPACHRD